MLSFCQGEEELTLSLIGSCGLAYCSEARESEGVQQSDGAARSGPAHLAMEYSERTKQRGRCSRA